MKPRKIESIQKELEKPKKVFTTFAEAEKKAKQEKTERKG